MTALALSLIPACLSASLVDCFEGFRWFQLAYWLLWLTALGTFSILACLLASLVDCFGDFLHSSLPIELFGWLLWRFRLFQLAYLLLWLTALALSLIPACFLASLVDCFGAFADSSLLIGFFGWLLWGLFLFQLAYWAISVDCFGIFADSSLPIGLFGWLLWRFRWFQLAYQLLWLTALALSLIPACLLASLVDCFRDFLHFSLLIGLFGWLLWGLSPFQLVSPPLD